MGQIDVKCDAIIQFVKRIDAGISKVKIGSVEKFLCHGTLGEQAADAINEHSDDIVKFSEDARDFIKSNGTEVFHFFDSINEAKAFWMGISLMDGNNGFTTNSYTKHMNFYGLN